MRPLALPARKAVVRGCSQPSHILGFRGDIRKKKTNTYKYTHVFWDNDIENCRTCDSTAAVYPKRAIFCSDPLVHGQELRQQGFVCRVSNLFHLQMNSWIPAHLHILANTVHLNRQRTWTLESLAFDAILSWLKKTHAAPKQLVMWHRWRC